MKKLLVMLMVIVMVAACLAGCGGSGTPATDTADKAGMDAADTAGTDTAGADTAEEEKTDEPEETDTGDGPKVWKIATDTVFRPFEYTDETGAFVGIDVDILAAVAEDQGFEYELSSLGWDASIAACQSGQADGMIAGASITDERKESGWIFSDGYYIATQCMAVAADSDIASFSDLEGLTVAVKTGTQGAAYAESLKDEYGFELTYFEDSPTMYQAVVGGQAVACFEDTPIISDYIVSQGLAMKVVEGTENEGAPYGFAIFNAEKQELIDMFNAGLKNIQDNGKYDEIIAKYLG